MDILIISSNPLFRDILSETLAGNDNFRTRAVDVAEAPEIMAASSPGVCILDQSIDAGVLEKIISAARCYAKCRMIMLTLEENGFTVLNSHWSTLKGSDDLIRAILRDNDA